MDGIIITDSYLQLVRNLIEKIHYLFSLKQFGDLDCFLGIEVEHTPSGLSQAKYVRDLLAKGRYVYCQRSFNSSPNHSKLSRYGSEFFEDPALNRSIVGAL